MLQLIHIATNTPFELPPNIKIPFNMFSPIFEEQGSNTFGFTLSATSPVNRKLTGSFHRPGKPDNSGSLIPVWLRVGGQQKRCTLQIIEADERIIKCSLLFDEGSFIVVNGDTTLNELDYGGEKTLANNYLPDWDDALHEKTWPEVTEVFPPIRNDNFFDGTPYETEYKTDIIFTNRTQSQLTTNSWLCPICPTPFLMHIINQCFENFGFKIFKNSLDVSPVNKLVLLNNVDNTKVSITVTSLVGAVGTRNKQNYNVANNVPEKTISSFLKSLRGKFNIVYFVNSNSGEVSLINFDEILNNPIKDDWSDYSAPLKLKTMPTKTGCNFIINGEKTPSFEELYYDYNDVVDKLILPAVSYDYLENGTFKLNTVYKVLVTASYYLGYAYFQLQYNESSDNYQWEYLGYSDVGNVYMNDGTEESNKFETEFGFTTEQNADVDATTVKLMPFYQATGISEYHTSVSKDFGMILAFFNPVGNDFDYPFASHIDTGNRDDFNLTLSPGHEKGTVNTFFKRTIEFYKNKGKIFETILTLPTSKLFNIDFAEKHKIYGGTFLVKNIKGYFTMRGVRYKSAEIVEC